MKIVSVIGTRPEIIKMAPLIKSIEKRSSWEQVILHSGQHYDKEMSEIFIDELKLPKPDYFLDAGAGTHAEQTAKMIVRMEKVLLKEKPDLVIYLADTNTAFNAALATAKTGMYGIHVEAGCRSFDLTMPEEINRTMISHMCDFNFAATKLCYNNLLNEGIPKSAISLTGHTIIEAINDYYKGILRKTMDLNNFNLEPNNYAILTLHRQENVDNKEKLFNIINALKEIDEKIFFPLHPRTKKRLLEFGLMDEITKLKNITISNPIRYFDMLKLIENSKFVMTDSGGVQQEAFILKKPCITLRCNTEWYETVESGANFLVGADKGRIITIVNKILKNYEILKKIFINSKNPFGDGSASKKMVNEIDKLAEKGLRKRSSNMIRDGYPKASRGG